MNVTEKITILYEDDAVLVCIKPAGMPSEGGSDALPVILSAQRCGAYIGTVHRLDTAVGGCMVFARTRESASALSAMVQDRRMKKEYLAVVGGVPAEPEGKMEDLLFKDSSKNKSYVVKRMRRGVKEARLYYRTLESVLDDSGTASLVHILLDTGRTHQIRVQFSSRAMPLLGDRKYGGREGNDIALWSWRISFPHPVSGRKLCFSMCPPAERPWNSFKLIAQNDENAMDSIPQFHILTENEAKTKK